MSLVLTNGTVVDQSGPRQLDIEINDQGVVASLGTGLRGDVELDVAGLVVAPGFVDLHTHLREPGNEEAETIETATRGAALGGFTAVVAMPNTTPAVDSPAVVQQVRDLARGALCEVAVAAAITVDRAGQTLAPMAELVRHGVRLFTDDGRGVQDDKVMRTALEYSTGLNHLGANGGPIVAQHCDLESLSAGGVMHEGAWSSVLGMPGQSAEAEELMIMRDIALVRLTGARMHFQHVSAAGSVAMISAAKEAGLDITAEATPHHFTLTDAECASFDSVYRVHPPLRTDADVAAVKQGLADGTIDAIATDHAPHTNHEKDRAFGDAPPGMLGLETAFALAVTELGLPIDKILALLSWQPAAIAGLADRHGGPIAAGRPANLVVVDPGESWTISRQAMASRSTNTPYDGRSVTGRVRHTILNGEIVVRDTLAQR